MSKQATIIDVNPVDVRKLYGKCRDVGINVEELRLLASTIGIVYKQLLNADKVEGIERTIGEDMKAMPINYDIDRILSDASQLVNVQTHQANYIKEAEKAKAKNKVKKALEGMSEADKKELLGLV